MKDLGNHYCKNKLKSFFKAKGGCLGISAKDMRTYPMVYWEQLVGVGGTGREILFVVAANFYGVNILTISISSYQFDITDCRVRKRC